MLFIPANTEVPPMKLTRLFQLLFLALALTSHAPMRAEVIGFSWWDPNYTTPGLLSDVRGGYTRDARLPDEPPIQVVATDFSTKTNSDVARILVVPPGSAIVDPNALTARAQSDFGQNHAETRTFTTGFAESEDRQYYDSRSHEMHALSIWADQWTFTGPGLGTAAVTLSARFDVNVNNSPCFTCGVSLHPALDRYVFKSWWYRLYGTLHVFDLDVIDEVYQTDSDYYPEVPHEVASFVVFRQGENSTRDFFSPIEPFVETIPNARLNPVHTNGTISFMPIAGHRYMVAGSLRIQSREGAEVDGFHTFSLDQVILGQGLRLQSVAATNNGAQFNVLASTSLTISRTGGDVTLSFPSATGFTYHVEYKTALNAPAWTSLTTRAGNGGTQTASDSNPGGQARFYRLRVE
jgi:hypothetical protein